MAQRQLFSRRNRYAGAAKEISIREEAPESLRFSVLETARGLGWSPSALRKVVCKVLRVRPDPNNWSAPNVWNEVEYLIYGCDWFKVYDIIEALYDPFAENDHRTGEDDAQRFADELNSFFIEEGIGWRIAGGEIMTRGTEAFESVVREASVTLEESGRPTAASSLTA